MARPNMPQRITHALPRVSGRPRRNDSVGSREGSVEQLPVAATPIAKGVSDRTAAPKDDAQHSTHYGTRSHDTPAALSGRATRPTSAATRQTSSGTARRGRPRKAAPYSAVRHVADDSDLESEDEAGIPVLAEDIIQGARDLADHPSDSTYSSEEESAVPRHRSSRRPRKDSLLAAKKAGNSSSGDSESESSDPVVAEPAADTSNERSSSEDSLSGEDVPPRKATPMRWKTSDVYVEINVNRSSDNSDSESSDDGDVDVAGTSANSPVDVASHANTDSAGVVVDSNPLLVGSQARHSGIDESEEEDDFLNEGNRANSQPVAGPGSAADLTVLDFLSQRVIDEINTVVQVLDGSSSAASLPNSTFLRLDCYAHEQVLVRKNHFTRKPFISGDQRPIDEDDVVQWASSLQRINMATLLLLVVRPLIAVTEPVSSSMPNRERMVSSMGLGAAAQGFFGNVAPANLRNVETVDLLVELVTQKILAAANDERHLQTLVSDELGISNAGIARLLSIENYNDSGSAGQHDRTRFDVYSVPHYRKELGRRLNRVSGGRLHTARSLFSQQALWKKMVAFCAQCSASWRAPSILGEVSSRQVDGSFNAVDEDDELMDSAGDSGRGAVLDTKGQTAKDSDVEETESVAGGHLVNAAPIDPSFREERRVAALLRDVQADAHLEELLEAIDAEHIGISDQQVQSHTPRRVRPARRRVLAQVGNNSGNDSEFRLDAEEEHASVPGSADESEDSSSGEQTDVRRRLGKRRVIPEYSSESDLEEEQLAPDTRTPVKRSRLMPRARVEASRQAGSFRGRRGIAAEDPLDLIDDGSSRVALTPSPGNPPAFNVRRGSSRGRSSGQESLTTGLEALGQYRPLKLARSTATQTAANRRNRRDDRSDHSDYSDTRHVAAAQARAGREKPIQHRVRWSQAEEECLMQALSELGPQWTLILEYHGKEGSRSRILRHRTRFNIKDKARNIKRRLIRENRPLGPLAAVTG